MIIIINILLFFKVVNCSHLLFVCAALGQVMLYVDGMNGVIEHSATVQWLYILVASKFRLVVKTALKLLLVFVEYVETNSVLLIKAIQTVDGTQGEQGVVYYIEISVGMGCSVYV